MEHDKLVQHLDRLLLQTYALWKPGWVTFNWRRYTYDHVQRVRALALSLCAEEGGDTAVTELAALLHDITKPYDGEIIVDEYDIPIQPDAPPGRYTIEVGMYQVETGQRLPIINQEGQVLDDRIVLLEEVAVQ